MGRFDEWLDDTRPVTVAPVTGIGDTIGMLMSHGNISPYIMAWLITVLIRLATGQGVVSAMTAAGIISAAILDPATGQLVGVDPALLERLFFEEVAPVCHGNLLSPAPAVWTAFDEAWLEEAIERRLARQRSCALRRWHERCLVAWLRWRYADTWRAIAGAL